MDFDLNNPHLAPNRYFDWHFEQEAVKILPGEYYVTAQQMLIVTVLGSCVSVCLRDPVADISGMNHFLLPSEGGSANDMLSESARYGVFAMDILINHMLKLGAARHRLEAKVFGGGNVLKGFTTTNVGERNAEFVLDYLKVEGIPVVGKDLLDVYPRKVYFFAETGQVLVRKIKNLHNTTIIDRESAYRMQLRQRRQSGDVELFDE